MKHLKGLVLVTAVCLFLAACAKEAEDAALQLPEESGVITLANSAATDEVMTEADNAEDAGQETAEALETLDYQAVQPYEVGQIMILMYHGIVESDPPSSYQRTVEDFNADLEKLYSGGYRLISLRDLLNNEISVEAGFTPVVMTFDDGLSSSFSLVRNAEGELIPAENCALDILDKFAEKHPDFGNTAVFHINGENDFFAGEGTLEERLRYLVEHGHDVGNHTYSHLSLIESGAEEIQAEIGRVDQVIKELLPDYEPYSISYPYGHRPGDETLRVLTLSGEYEGKAYRYQAALRVGQSGTASAPNRKNYDTLNLPRVRGSDDEETDLGWHLRYYEENPEYRYVSDGDPFRIAVPEEYAENVDMDSLDGRELYLYEKATEKVTE